jgi:hypothetical protein
MIQTQRTVAAFLSRIFFGCDSTEIRNSLSLTIALGRDFVYADEAYDQRPAHPH